MKRFRVAVVVAAAVAAGAALVSGCGMNMAGQLSSNEQFRTQVFDAIVANRSLANGMVDKLMASDTTRIAIVDKMLANDEVAKQVIVRIATNPDAMDLVMGAAVQDSAMRAHVMTLFKGMQMASKK